MHYLLAGGGWEVTADSLKCRRKKYYVTQCYWQFDAALPLIGMHKIALVIYTHIPLTCHMKWDLR